MDKCNLIIQIDTRDNYYPNELDIWRVVSFLHVDSGTLPFLFLGNIHIYSSNLYNSTFEVRTKEITQKFYGKI